MSAHKIKPNIGITRNESQKISVSYMALWLAIRLAGGRPRILSRHKHDVPVHGLVLGGGTDIYPELFQQLPKKNYKYDRTRDARELKWLKYANEEKIPVIAICRGAQLLNVFNKGTLHMHVGDAYEDADYPGTMVGQLFFRKAIIIKKQSLLYQLFGKSTLKVNSIHKQAIDKVGQELIVTAREKNGIIQCIEREHHPFYIGVQFHPELMIYNRAYRRFFRKFVDAVRKEINTHPS